MVPEASEEGSLSGARGFTVVVGKFSSGKEVLPVCAFAVDIGAEHVLDCADGTFRLAVGLGVASGGHFQGGAKDRL